MRLILSLSILAMLAVGCSVQDTSEEMQAANVTSLKSPYEFINEDGVPLPSVSLVGTFHFGYPNLDAYVTDSSDMVDVLSPTRQNEMEDLLDYLAKFNPNKIVIESTRPDIWNRKLREYKADTLAPERDERHQLGLALAKRFQLDTLYCLDAGAFASEYAAEGCPVLDSVFVDYDFRSDDPIEKRLVEYLDYRDKQLKNMTLLDYISDMNTEESWNFNYGAYLIGDFKLDEFRGADALATYWYNRNLRIFRKIQLITESPDDRILVIFGNGHVSILHQLFKCSPEYDYVTFGSLHE